MPNICNITVVISFKDVIELDKQINGGQMEIYSRFGRVRRQTS